MARLATIRFPCFPVLVWVCPAWTTGFAWGMCLRCPGSSKSKFIWLAAWSLAGATLVSAAIPYRELAAPDTVLRDLKGAVREMHEQSYKLGKEGERILVADKTAQFDREGYLVMERTQEAPATAWNTETRTYVEDPTKLPPWKGYDRTMETDLAKKRVTWRARDSAGRLLLAKEVTYDAFRKVAAGRDYDATGRLTQSYRVTRDARGLGTEILFLDASGRVKYRSVPTWDERDIMIGSRDEFVADHLTAVRMFDPVAVDATGNWTELHKGGKFQDKAGEHPIPPEVIIRVFEYYAPAT